VGDNPIIPTLPPDIQFRTNAPSGLAAGEPQTVTFEDDYTGEEPYEEYEAYVPTKQDFRTGGIISLALTLANILLVIIASIVMYR
jgi:hypothetical protein